MNVNRPALPLRIESNRSADEGWEILDREGAVIAPQTLVDLVNKFPELVNRAFPEGTGVTIKAEWKPAPPDESAKDAIFLMAGEACLGYIDRDGKSYMACVGSGMGAPIVAAGVLTLDECKQAVEGYYSRSPQAQITGETK